MDRLLGSLRRFGRQPRPRPRRRTAPAVRRLSGLVATLVVLLTAGLAAGAQEATPGALPALASYLELPAEVVAGRYVVTVENASSGLAGAYPIRRPAGVSADQMQAGIQAAIATPEGRVPEWFYETVAVGGPFAPPGAQTQTVVDLEPGPYGVLNPGTGVVAALEVTAGPGATPVAPAEPPADLAVEMREYTYVGLPERVAPGPQVWAVTNTGAQPHELALLRAPAGTTFDQVMAVLMAPPDATPVPGGVGFAALVPVGGVGYLSPGRTAWGVLDLAPGTYVALCFTPDRESGMPHAAMGMVAVFAVGETGTPTTGTPAA